MFVSELFRKRGEDDVEQRKGRRGWISYRLREDLGMQLDPIDEAAQASPVDPVLPVPFAECRCQFSKTQVVFPGMGLDNEISPSGVD